MKKQFFILLGVLAMFDSIGQVQLQDGINQNLMLISTKESDRMKTLEGSPFLQEEFNYGTATVEGKQPLNVFLRYNVHQDQIEIKTDVQSEEVYLLPKKESTVYQIGSDTFVLDEFVFNGERISGYFIEHYKGKNFRLLEKSYATVTEAVKAKTGYDRDRPARIEIDEEFFVVNDQGAIKKVRVKHRDIKKAYDSDRAKEYLSDNRIRSKEDLISFVSFLDEQ